MSEQTLTPAAPGGDPAAAGQEPVAPAVISEVTAGSAGNPDLIEKARFDGLMGTYNREKDTWLKERQQYEAELANLRNQPAQENDTVADEAILAELQALRQEVTQERLNTARAQALSEFPEAAPFGDMLVGASPEEIRASAAAVAERLKGFTAPAPSTSEGTPPATPAAPPLGLPTSAPVVGGTVPVSGDPTVEDRIAVAIGKANTPGPMGTDRESVWKEYLAAKRAQARDDYQRQMAGQE